MKRVMIVLVTIGLFTSCNNNKGKSTPETKTTTKDDYRTNDSSNNNKSNTTTNTDNSNKTNTDNTTNNNATGWSSADVKSFVDNCVSEAEKGMSPATAQNYCNCMQKKLEQKYPDTKDVNNLDMESLEMKQMVKDCLQDNQ